ncbi:cytochrome P450 [Periconia macrospinosa]|uniref:Cytochrome P450 n=1 Tax=Periconia macrospinosa TaxID=97972 RepID=A0A2V1DEN7_9PLEO|nr:cytochrome P450 [Periconia macrospinosa]
MEYAIISVVACLTLFTLYLLQRQRRRNAIIHAHGGGKITQHYSWEPLTGIDFYMKTQMEIPWQYHHHQRYGHTFTVCSLLSQPTIYTIAPENIRAVNSEKAWGIEPLRLEGMEYFCGQGFLTTDGEIWQHSRKLLKPTFAKANLLDLSILSREFDQLVHDIPKEGTAVDLQPLFDTMFLNTSLKFLLGVDPKHESIGAPHTSDKFIDAFHSSLFLTMIRLLLGSAWRLVPQSKYLSSCQVAHDYLDYYIKKALLDSEQPATQRTSSMLDALSVQTKDLKYIRSQILQGMMASQETTSALLGNACFLLSRNPHYWSQIQKETMDVDSNNLTFDYLANLKLVKNILFETLRLYPNFPMLARISLNDTILPRGAGPDGGLPVFVPKGTLVSMGYYGLHRNTQVFGDDIETFRPERWEDIHPGPWEYMAFGGGNRSCMGQQKVLIEAAYVLIRLAKTFSTLESRDSSDWRGELKLSCKSANGCKVAIVA